MYSHAPNLSVLISPSLMPTEMRMRCSMTSAWQLTASYFQTKRLQQVSHHVLWATVHPAPLPSVWGFVVTPELNITAVRLWGWCCPQSFIPSGLKIKVQNNIEKSHISGSYGCCLSSSHCTGKLAGSHNIA